MKFEKLYKRKEILTICAKINSTLQKRVKRYKYCQNLPKHHTKYGKIARKVT